MNHAHNPISRGRAVAVAAWTVLVTAAVLGITSNDTSQLISAHFRSGGQSFAVAAEAVAEAATEPATRHDTLPIVLTIPFAVTRTQQMMVARLKHRAELAHRMELVRANLKSAPGFLAGLALIGASQARGR